MLNTGIEHRNAQLFWFKTRYWFTEFTYLNQYNIHNYLKDLDYKLKQKLDKVQTTVYWKTMVISILNRHVCTCLSL